MEKLLFGQTHHHNYNKTSRLDKIIVKIIPGIFHFVKQNKPTKMLGNFRGGKTAIFGHKEDHDNR